jgi:hypothetical protein
VCAIAPNVHRGIQRRNFWLPLARRIAVLVSPVSHCMGFAHGEAHGEEAEAHSVPSDSVKPEAECVEDHDPGSDWDSDGSGWNIDESRIQFTEAGYELYSNGFNEDELPSGFTSTLVDTQDTLPVEGAVTDVSTQPQSSVQRQRAWSVRGMRFEVSADIGRGTVPLDADIMAAVTATMARVQLEVPASFKAVPEDVLEATLKRELLAARARTRAESSTAASHTHPE